MSDEYPPTTQGEVTPDVEALHMIIGLGNFEATGGTGSNTYDLALRIVDSDWLEAHDREVAELVLNDAADALHGNSREAVTFRNWLSNRAASFSTDKAGASE